MERSYSNEIDSLCQNKAWVLIDLPWGARPIDCKLIFKRKLNPDGSIDKYSARLVAEMFTQKENVDYFDIFAHITRIPSTGVLIALASVHKLVIN